jgi:two-component system sensor histidine kinase QseC
MQAMISIRRRILTITLSAFAVTWLIATSTTMWHLYSSAPRYFDQDLINYADLILNFTLASPDSDKQIKQHDLNIPFKVIKNGEVFAYSEKGIVLEPGKAQEFSIVDIETPDGIDQWRILSRHDPRHNIWVLVGESRKGAKALTTSILAQVISPNLLGLIFIMAVLIWGTGRGLKPLNELARDVAKRTPSDLAPIQVESAPSEVIPVIASLNQLLTRLHAALENEHRFTANAAHELRTPLASLKTETQVLQKLAGDNDEAMAQALERINIRVDRATHLINQLLILARVENLQEMENISTIFLDELFHQVLIDSRQSVEKKRITLTSILDEDCTLNGDATLLSVMIGNLLDNAIRYTPESGEIIIKLESLADSIRLTISDNGPGVPEERYKDIFDKFYRLPGNQQQGTGLGLSIVQRIADLYEAKLKLRPWKNNQGLQVEISFKRHT